MRFLDFIGVPLQAATCSNMLTLDESTHVGKDFLVHVHIGSISPKDNPKGLPKPCCRNLNKELNLVSPAKQGAKPPKTKTPKGPKAPKAPKGSKPPKNGSAGKKAKLPKGKKNPKKSPAAAPSSDPAAESGEKVPKKKAKKA